VSATVLYMSTSLDARVRSRTTGSTRSGAAARTVRSRSRCCTWRRGVVEVVDWGRPELLRAFGLAMSFPGPHRSNKDKLNAKEVR
jgi:hypothetical protein